MGRFHESAVHGQVGAVGCGPLSLHSPAVGFPRGQQVLESLEKEGDKRKGRSGSLVPFSPGASIFSGSCQCPAWPLAKYDPLWSSHFIHWQIQELNEGAPQVPFQPQIRAEFQSVVSLPTLLTHLRDGDWKVHSVTSSSHGVDTFVRFLVIPIPHVSDLQSSEVSVVYPPQVG